MLLGFSGAFRLNATVPRGKGRPARAGLGSQVLRAPGGRGGNSGGSGVSVRGARSRALVAGGHRLAVVARFAGVSLG
jgi:hypothetical protein